MMAGIRLVPERMEAIDYSYPFDYYKYIYFVKVPEDIDLKQFLLLVMSPSVWVALFFTIVFLMLLHWFILRLLLHREEPLTIKSLTDITEKSGWALYSILLKQHWSGYLTHASTLLITAWVLFCVFFTNVYQALIQSILTAPLRIQIPFENLDQLLGKCYTFWFWRGLTSGF